MISFKELERLSHARKNNFPITTLYLNVNGASAPGRDHEIQLKAMIKEKKERAWFGRLDSDAKKSVENDFVKIARFVKDGYNRKGTKSIVAFASEKLGIWETFELKVSSQDTLMVNPNPYIKPLSALLSEHRNFAVILVDRAKARVYRVELGTHTELYNKEIDVETKPREAGFGGTEERKIERHADAATMKHFKELAEVALKFHNQRAFNWVLIGGRKNVLGEFEKSLHPYISDRIVGRFHVEPDTPIDDVFEKVKTFTSSARETYENELVQRLSDAVNSGNQGAEGPLGCIEAVSKGKVNTLVVEKGYIFRGFACSKCDWIGIEMQPACPICNTENLEKTPDVVEDIILHTLRMGGTVEHVSNDLSESGHIGAILRY